MRHCKTLSIMPIVFIVTAVIFISTNASAKPSKEETYNFIVNKLTIDGIKHDEFRRKMFGYNISNAKLTSSNDMCTITYINDIYDVNNKPKRTIVSTASLKDINPNTISANQFESTIPYAVIEILTTSKKKLIEYNTIEYNESGAKTKNESDMRHYLGLFALDYDQATRAVKALKNLVVICGGKDELF